MKYLFVSLVCLSLFASFGARAEERYSEWGSNDAKYDALVERLNELIDSAEKARAADPRLLQDLREALEEHGGGAVAAAAEPEAEPQLPPQILVRDDFRDGNFTRNPGWTMVQGRFTVDSGLGLRSVVAKPVVAEKKSSKEKRKELVTDVLSSLLGSKSKEPEPTNTQPAQPERAEIFIRTPISNAFQLVFEVVSREKHGRFSLDLFQGRSRGAGYRLSYTPGATPGLQLKRFGSGGTRNIAASNGALNLEDNFRHRVEFNRDVAGGMTVSIDGAQLLNAADQSFRDPFSGITIANDGGDYSLREITVFGTR